MAVVAQLILPPVFLSQWGLSRYGEWLVLAAIPAFLTWAHLGLATAGGNRMVMCAAQGDAEGLARAARAAQRGVGLICAALLIVATVAALTMPWRAWLGISRWCEAEVQLTVLFLAVGSVAQLAGGLSLAFYRAALRDARGIWRTTWSMVFQAAITIFVVSFSQSAVILAATGCVAQIAFAVWMWQDANRLLHVQKLPAADRSWRDLGDAVQEGGAQMLFPLANAVYFQGGMLVVNHVLGSGAAAAFAILRTLSRTLAQTASVGKLAAGPECSLLFGREDWPQLRRLCRLGCQATLVATSVLALGLLLAGPWFVAWWTRGGIHVSRGLLSLFVAGAWLNALGAFGLGLAQATNRPVRAGLWQAAGSVAALGLMMALAGPGGLAGAASAMIVGEAIIMWAGWRGALELVRDRWTDFLSAMLRLRELREELWGKGEKLKR